QERPRDIADAAQPATRAPHARCERADPAFGLNAAGRASAAAPGRAGAARRASGPRDKEQLVEGDESAYRRRIVDSRRSAQGHVAAAWSLAAACGHRCLVLLEAAQRRAYARSDR